MRWHGIPHIHVRVFGLLIRPRNFTSIRKATGEIILLQLLQFRMDEMLIRLYHTVLGYMGTYLNFWAELQCPEILIHARDNVMTRYDAQ